MAQEYISAYTGAEIDRAIGAFINNENAIRSIYAHVIDGETNTWEESQGTGYQFEITATFTGTFNPGEFPRMYFIEDGTNDYYELDHKTISMTSSQVTVKAFSNVDMNGSLVVVSSLSGVNV